jgi:hypothetical protein
MLVLYVNFTEKRLLEAYRKYTTEPRLKRFELLSEKRYDHEDHILHFSVLIS